MRKRWDFPDGPISDNHRRGHALSGTTGQPKGILRPLPEGTRRGVPVLSFVSGSASARA
jgi:hypothetical protein